MVLAGVLTGTARADMITYFHNDPSGSPVAATDENGRLLWKESYRPYGERLLNGASPDANRLWFTGKPQDPDTGLSYLGARYYSPQLGRFMGIDPKAVDPGDPHSFNRYAYANNNPYKFVDPDGEFAVFAFVAAAVTTGIITNNALNAYDQNTSVFDEGISGRGVNAAAASVATDTAIAAGAVAIGAGLSVLEASVVAETTTAIRAAEGATSLNPASVRFSQSSVNGVEEVAASMRVNG
jgi:RHS repeat-associated protein